MKQNIIHIFLLMIGATLAASCSSERDPEIAGSAEMNFEVNENVSRATITNSVNLKDTPFMLFGDLNSNGYYFDGLKKIFDGSTVTYSSKDKKWDYGTTQYWLMDQEHSFVAIHPASAIEDMSDLKYDNSTLSFTYSIAVENKDTVDYSGVKDLLVATHRRKATVNNLKDNVNFSFRHLMAQIHFLPALDEVLMYDDDAIKDEDHPDNKHEYILIRKIELEGLKTKAQFTFTPKPVDATNQTYAFEGKYDLDDASIASSMISLSGNKEISNNNTHVDICTGDDVLFVLPQTFDEDSEAKFILSYTVNDDHPLRRIIIPIKDISWEAGKIYTYKFTIDKAYTGQIKPGSLTIEIDLNGLPEDVDDSWINGGDVIRFDFNADGTRNS